MKRNRALILSTTFSLLLSAQNVLADGSGDYGSEFDVSAGTKLTKNYGVLFKGAFFSGDSASCPDTNKFWIMFTANC